ncbi:MULTISPECIES: TadE/TadG family type IV pilus assembly protein [Halocynthiibacter]|uniref:Pilus assembly protein n=1 Tax=Halocynthiibacter halioticoli TaxID=2986804 RepID=A0AAE3J1E7_9RHOB|nr:MULTISPECIES: TadE/TadG family type IV pilus assembly protein [Halocynthiibacter]MCV6824945.1 pilus assembly protein [Halocynthiibacter halioticoli]MCW4057946.1 pilus assembly protein [Halocynthiibacter sp. SDUM655004]
MIRLGHYITKAFRRFRKSETGNVTIEFVILFPMFMSLLLGSIEVGVIKTRQVMLERAVDLAVRDLRLGTWNPPTHNELKERICSETRVIPDCEDVMLIELRPVSTLTWEPLGAATTCVDRAEEVQPVTQFEGGDQNEMMLVRVCVIVDPFFQSSAYGLDLPKHDQDGGYAIVSTSAFVNEPN